MVNDLGMDGSRVMTKWYIDIIACLGGLYHVRGWSTLPKSLLTNSSPQSIFHLFYHIT